MSSAVGPGDEVPVPVIGPEYDMWDEYPDAEQDGIEDPSPYDPYPSDPYPPWDYGEDDL
jgi:hypothetical protein